MPIALRPPRRAALVLGAALAVACALATPSAQATSLLTCPAGTQSNTYNPALTNTPATVTLGLHTDYGTCVGLSPLTRTGATSVVLAPATRSCLDLLTPRRGVSLPIRWSTGTTSVLTGDNTSEFLPGGILQATYAGTVTAGEFLGGHFLYVAALAGSDPPACSTTGVTTASGTVTLVIAP